MNSQAESTSNAICRIERIWRIALVILFLIALLGIAASFVPSERFVQIFLKIKGSLGIAGDAKPGPSIARLIEMARWEIPSASLVIALAASLAYFQTRALNSFFASGFKPLHSPGSSPVQLNVSSLMGFLSISSLVLFSSYPTLLHGYFRYDDFEMLEYAATTPPLQLMLMVHGDHSLPLFRLQTSFMQFAFGSNPFPYNLAQVSLFAAMFFSAFLVLRELGVSSRGTLFFAAFGIVWPLWGELTVGYYCLVMFLELTTLSFLSVWLYLFHLRTGRWLPLYLVPLLSFVAPLIDLSGVWVPCASLTFIICDQLRRKGLLGTLNAMRSNAPLILTWVVIAASAVHFSITCFQISHAPFLSMKQRGGVHPLIGTCDFLLGAVCCGTLFPSYHTAGSGPALLAVRLIGGFVFTLVLLGLFRVPKELRLNLCAMLLILGGIALLVSMGRSIVPFQYPTKYACPAIVWYLVLVASILDFELRRLPVALAAGITKLGTLALLLLLGVWTVHANFRPDFLTSTSVRSRVLEQITEGKAAVADLRRVFQPLLRESSGTWPICTLDGAFIAQQHPALAEYNLAHYVWCLAPDRPATPLLRTTGMQDWVTPFERTVPDLATSVNPAFLQQLETDPDLQRYYFAPVKLRQTRGSEFLTAAKPFDFDPATLSEARLTEKGLQFRVAKPGLKITLAKSFSPADRHRLEIQVSPVPQNDPPQNSETPIEIEFTGARQFPYRMQQLSCSSLGTIVDLNQLYLFSLNATINELTVTFPTPGDYLISRLKLTSTQPSHPPPRP